MSTPYKLGLAVILLALAFGAGRYTSSGTTDKTSDTSSTEKEKEKTDTHTITKTIIVKQPDGTTKTVITADTKTETKETQVKDEQSHQETVNKPGSKLNVSLLGSYDLNSPSKVPALGLSVSKEVLGPVTAGVWGMNNGSIGLSIGIDF